MRIIMSVLQTQRLRPAEMDVSTVGPELGVGLRQPEPFLPTLPVLLTSWGTAGASQSGPGARHAGIKLQLVRDASAWPPDLPNHKLERWAPQSGHSLPGPGRVLGCENLQSVPRTSVF